MTETVSVSVSGAAFSLLLYENLKSEYDQDGLLLGSIISKETNKLTDADHRVVNKEQIIKVNSVLPCPKLFYFYDAAGMIDKEKIQNMLDGYMGTVVGWYIFKRKRPNLQLTLREKIIHKQLANFLCHSVSYFTCCLLNTYTNEIGSTHSFCQTFVRYHMGNYEGLPLHIENLSDPSYTFKSAEPGSAVLNELVEAVKNSGETEGHVIITKVQDAFQQRMKNLVTELADKEKELFTLEQEVKQLMYNQKMKREYGGEEETEADQDISEAEVVENGAPEQESSQNTESSLVDGSPDSTRRKRGRPRKQVNPVQDNLIVSSSKTSDAAGDHLKENQTISQRSTGTRPKTKISYAEMAQNQKKKN